MKTIKMNSKRLNGFLRLGLATIIFASIAAIPAVLTIQIDVSPNTLNLQNQGTVVTVHTDVAYSLVNGAMVTLNGLEIDWWKSDDRGNFVAKFDMSAVKGLPLNIGDYNELKMTGSLTTGQAFEGTQEILVINNIPKK